jgi:peptide methionine sulfoxide reductase msrA/msrB
MKPKDLKPEEAHIIIHKGTEPPFSGKYHSHFANGIYSCRQCAAPLYRSYDKFDAGCGWPSFDDELPGAVSRQTDPDGHRTEITCQQCQGHLGHVFAGEHQTPKNLRHCVNSLSMQFIDVDDLAELAIKGHERFGAALLAAGCFWGVEHALINTPGVLATQVGYTGGHLANPTYEDVCRGDTGHAETVLVIYDKVNLDYEQLLVRFFEIHEPSQVNRQGPDIGRQYRSAIFYFDADQRKTAESIIEAQQQQGQVIATEVTAATDFWPAEAYHQHYHRQHT